MSLRRFFVLLSVLALTIFGLVVVGPPAAGDHTPPPGDVTITGSLQDELGCTGDWQPECATTLLTFDGHDVVWQGTFALPAGDFEYKATLNNSWGENYGAGGVRDGANILLNLGADTDVKFYYDHGSHWVTDDVNSVIATASGDFQSELGCPGDWQPDCLRSWMQDPDGDGVYEFATDAIPAGDYEFKVALDETWDTSFPADNVAFAVAADGDLVTMRYDSATNVVTVISEGGSPPICSGATPSETSLWPPNHKYHNISVEGVADPNGDAFTLTVDSIFQDEAVDAPGSGNTAPDGQGVGTSTAQVRAERSGGGNGRVYHIGFSAVDGYGGACSGEVLVGVPHNKKAISIDEGALFDSTLVP